MGAELRQSCASLRPLSLRFGKLVLDGPLTIAEVSQARNVDVRAA